MKFLTTTRLAAMVLLALAGAAGAQSETEQERRKMEIKAEEERRQVEIEAEQKLREAEIRLQEAAEEVARLTEGRTRRLVVNSSGGRLHGDGPKLGVALSSTRVNGERDGEGIKVMSVSPGSAAADAGILVGDRLLAVDTKSLTEVDTMEASLAIGKVLKDKEEGDSINLKVLRDGKPRTIKVTLNDQSFSTNSFAFAFG
ncbi:MAG: PDZ domain-containing protein, partial [Pseudomonadota bacterium]